MEYQKLDKPIYWIGYNKGQFIKRKFVERQTRFPRYLRDTEGNIRYFSKEMESKMGEIRFVGGYSEYSYTNFTKNDEIQFLREMVKHNNKRAGQIQRKLDSVNKETNKFIDMIKELEKE